jgi:hypothetical protein
LVTVFNQEGGEEKGGRKGVERFTEGIMRVD